MVTYPMKIMLQTCETNDATIISHVFHIFATYFSHFCKKPLSPPFHTAVILQGNGRDLCGCSIMHYHLVNSV